MNILEVEKVSKHYDDFVALNQVSLEVKEGSVFGLLGPNGAGKTSLIRIINQITAPDSGQIRFLGEPLKAKHVEQIGYLPEERGLYKKMKVGQQAVYLATLKGLSPKIAEQRLRLWFQKFEIDSWWNKKVEELSKGMQQKVQFIITIIHEPKFFIFDEPFSGFDPINANLLKEEMLNLKSKGASIIFSTHNMASVEELCDDIALIDRSNKILQGNVKAIKQEFRENLFEVKYYAQAVDLQKVIDPQAQVVEIKQEGDLQVAKLKATPTMTGNDLLKLLLPNVNIFEFKEILPTMENIFIACVNRNKEK